MTEAERTSLRTALERTLGPRRVHWDERSLEACERDTWVIGVLHHLRRSPHPFPLCVVRPRSTAEVAATLRLAYEAGAPIIPYGGGSGVCGGIVPVADAVIIDLREMNRLLALDDTSLTCVVQPGMFGHDLEESLGTRGYTTGHYPQSIALSTLGGWAATRSAGQFSTKYGNIEDVVMALEAVVPPGEVVRLKAVPRAATGPDLRHLFLGSEGALAVVTELTLRVWPVPEARRGTAVRFAGPASGLEALRRIVRCGWRPAVVRLYDQTESAWHFPAASGGKCMCLLLSEGPATAVEVEVSACAAICETAGGTLCGDGPVQEWLAKRNEVPTFESFLRQGLVVDTIEVAATWDRIGSLYERVIAALSAQPEVVSASGHSSHSYLTGTNIYFSFAARPQRPEDTEAVYFACWRAAMEATLACGGTIAHHHGVGRLRTPWMRAELGSAYALLERLKQALDPKGLMNPGALLSTPPPSGSK